jgi:hypothetical protein
MAALSKQAEKKVLGESRLGEAKSGNDTVRLCENYRERALLWRALALLQIPAILIALVFALVMWINRETILNVPPKPLPGYYPPSAIPDAEFLSVATEWVNLVATYQPKVARKQFEEAAKVLDEHMLSRFQTEMIGRELESIENTMRTQVYYVNPTATNLVRDQDNNVIVTVVGERSKIAAGQELPQTITQFRLTMTTKPRTNTIWNDYGIVITDVETIDN